MGEHRIRVYREEAWPRQWLGLCSCGNGTRCNSEQQARSYLRRMGCLGRAVSVDEQG